MSAPVLPEDQVEVPAVVLPDRADAPISEITERFFRALLTKVPIERIEEVHLFSPLRSGGVETGIAVIAAREVVVAPAPVDEPLPMLLDDAVAVPDAVELDDAATDHATSSDANADDADADEADANEANANEANAAGVASDEVGADAPVIELSDASPYADEEIPLDDAVPAELVHQLPVQAEVSAPVVRHTVYTARYRLVQKGPERGKWESTVVAEAEAPLITVETVVRGVQRRAGEESETTRFSAAQLVRALRLDPPVSA
jgi:hypothetical protein